MKKILVALFLGVLAFALSESEIEPKMSEKVATAVEILKTNGDKNAKAEKIFALFDEYFDYNLMAKLSLSKQYKTLSNAEQERFNKAFENRLKASFIDKLKLYTNQEMKVVSAQKLNEKRITLKTQIIGEDKNYPIDFKFYPDNGVWRVYDVDILGVSIVQTYRSQFGENALIFDEIIAKLNAANLPDEKK